MAQSCVRCYTKLTNLLCYLREITCVGLSLRHRHAWPCQHESAAESITTEMVVPAPGRMAVH
eukprot:scaffold252354_cov27-Prasinocladus_malaysianus.AAC.2